MERAETRWDPGRLLLAIEGGVVIADAEGRAVVRNEVAEALLGGPATFGAAWRFVHECIRREVDRARLMQDREAALNVVLPRELAERTLYVRVLPAGDREDSGYLALFKERRALDALQSDLRLAVQMRHLHGRFQQAA